EEEADEDDWNVSMAAGTCLALLAQCVEDAVVAPVIPFIENHIRNNDWRFREAAVMAFGSILEGPEHKLLANLVNQALPVLIDMMRDPSPQVKDTTAWTLGRVSELLIECIKPDVHLHPLITALVYGLKDSPRIVSNCCWALMSLSDQFGSKETAQPSYHLSAYFEGIITALYLEAFAPFLYGALSNHEEYQLCSIAVGLIGDICRALQEQSLPYCDTFMNVLLQNLQSPVLNRNVKPAILSCFGDIALAIGGRFEVYLEIVMLVLLQASNMRADGVNVMTNYDMIDYVIALREGILEAYVGIVQGLKSGEKVGLFVSDLAEAFQNGQIKQWFQYDCVTQVLREGRNNRNLPNGTREVTRWAKE
ncbi:9975_t:CDS:2, partial [Racocetra fulgida]